MEVPPSLIALCTDAVAKNINFRKNFSVLNDLPDHLFDALITKLPPFGLERLQHHIELDGISESRLIRISDMWSKFFGLRWPDRINRIQPINWRKAYWEAHLQDCLDEGRYLIKSLNGSDMQISDRMLKYIGLVGDTEHSTCSDLKKLFYHCQEFGSHVSCLKLQSPLCREETRGLLSKCKLESLGLRCIRSKEEVDELCELIVQHRGTLTSLEFIHCTGFSNFIGAVNQMFQSVITNDDKKYGIKRLSIVSSLESGNGLPSSLVSFLSSARSLCSLKLSDCYLEPPFAKVLFQTLLHNSSGISDIDLSENEIEGWLYNFPWRFSNGKSFESLCILNLRRNNLKSGDVEDLSNALAYMPNLEDLDISENPIRDEGIRHLIPHFAVAPVTCSRVACLKFERCNLGSDGGEYLLDSFSQFRGPLKSLSIADNEFVSNNFAKALGRFLRSPIEIVDASKIGLGVSGFQYLGNLITKKLSLVKINISNNFGEIEAANFLSKLLWHAPQLSDVNAASNNMPIESLSIISSALKCAKGKVRHLDLRGHKWDLQPVHYSEYTELAQDGKPILILPKPLVVAAPDDNDP